jgi:flagellar biosynthesis activator protein FlaF
MSYNGYTAYKSVQNKTEDPRDIEYRLLAQVTGALIKGRDNPKEFKARVEAILWNRDVWSALRVDLSAEDNALPNALRASLISVSIWIEKETYALLDGKGDLDAVIEINRNIMAGLKPENAQEASPLIS